MTPGSDTITTDMLASPLGAGWTRFVLGMGGRPMLDFSAPDEKIELLETEAATIAQMHGIKALKNRADRDFSKAANIMLDRQDSDPLLRLIVFWRIAASMPCRHAHRTLS